MGRVAPDPTTCLTAYWGDHQAGLWHRLRRAWLAATAAAPTDPRLAEEAGLAYRPPHRCISPLVGAFLH